MIVHSIIFSLCLLMVPAVYGKQYFDLRDLFDDMQRGIETNFHNFSTASPSFQSPSFHLSDEGDFFVVEMALPGMTRDDITITVDDAVDGALLTVKGETEQVEAEENETKSYRRGSVYQSNFSQTIKLPQMVVIETVKAELANGILRVMLPKAKSVKKTSRTVNIGTTK
jgi:HSP20 family protein